MSNYLQRLAAQALGERASIRPLMPPRFAAAEATASPEVVTETAAPQPAAPEAEPRRLHRRHREEAAPAAGLAEAIPTEPAVPHPARQPGRPAVGRPSMVTPQAVAGGPAEPERPPRIVAVAEQSTSLPAYLRLPAISSGRVPDPPPLRPTATVSPIAPIVRPPHPAAKAPSDRAARRDSERMPAPDVHIHIGRIELTALSSPPPAARAPTPAKRSGLDDYLRRTERKRQ
ncbi:MAG: hypothetical protein QOK41_1826 [Sphingomonadales bacterium]|nr:hypothetical protein [Sphingomonadales bacterium]